MDIEILDEIDDELNEITAVCNLLIFSDITSIAAFIPDVAKIICKKIELLRDYLEINSK